MTVLVYILLCLIWGSTWMAIKIGLQEAPPLTTAAMRFVLAASILSTIALVRGFRFPQGWRNILRIAYPGLYMYGISYASIYFAEQYIDSSLTSVLFGSFPFFVAILSWLRYKSEKMTPVAWAGMMIGFTGVVLISYHTLTMSGDLFLGTCLAVFGSFASAYGIVIHKRHHVELNIVVSSSVQMILGGLPLVIAAIVFENPFTFMFSAATLGSIAYLAIFGTVVAFLGYYWLLKRTEAVTVSLIAFLTPIVAITIGVAFGNESMSPLIIAGSVMVLGGIFLVIRRHRSTQAAPEPRRV